MPFLVSWIDLLGDYFNPHTGVPVYKKKGDKIFCKFLIVTLNSLLGLEYCSPLFFANWSRINAEKNISMVKLSTSKEKKETWNMDSWGLGICSTFLGYIRTPLQ